jgi:hypothetical protein
LVTCEKLVRFILTSQEQISEKGGLNSTFNTDIKLKTLKFWKIYSDGTFGLESEVPDPHYNSYGEKWQMKANTRVISSFNQ